MKQYYPAPRCISSVHISRNDMCLSHGYREQILRHYSVPTQSPEVSAHDQIASPNFKPGIPNLSTAPFRTPPTNLKSNRIRFLQATKILREAIKLMVPSDQTLVHTEFASLFGFLDRMFMNDQRLFCEVMDTLYNWYKIYVVRGTNVQGSVPAAYWSVRAGCPAPIILLVRAIDMISNGNDRYQATRLLLSTLNLARVMVVPSTPRVESITNAFSGKDETASAFSFKEIFKRLGINPVDAKAELSRRCADGELHESMSAGPNGHAVWSAHLDAYEVWEDKPLLKYLTIFCKAVGIKTIDSRITNVLTTFKWFDLQTSEEKPFSHGCHSKLHALYEKSTKARIIAIGDFFTQSALTPMHDVLAGILRTLPSDFTFNQDGGFQKVMDMSTTNNNLNSLDLSSATDRLPVKAQAAMLSALFDSKLIGNS